MPLQPDRKFYLCPPDALELRYSINPWTDLNAPFSREKAHEQWQNLVNLYEELVPGKIEIIPVKAGLTELCFCGDSVFAWKDKAVFSHFKYPERRPETEYVREVLEQRGIHGTRVLEGIEYEGSGETMLWRDKILVGHGQRSSAQIAGYLADYFDAEVIGFAHVDPYFFHLDTALFPINDDLIAVYAEAFSEESRLNLDQLDCEILHLTRADAEQFALNSIALGNDIIVPAGAAHFQTLLKKLGFRVHSLDVSEFLKFGGGVKCLTFQHYL